MAGKSPHLSFLRLQLRNPASSFHFDFILLCLFNLIHLKSKVIGGGMSEKKKQLSDS